LPVPPRAGKRQEAHPLLTELRHNLGQFHLPANERVRLIGQVIGPGIERFQRGELGGQIGVEQLEDALRLEQIAQAVRAKIEQRHARGERIACQRLRGGRQYDLPTVTGAEQARQPGHRGRQIVTIPRRRLAHVDRHAHAQRSGLGPRFGAQRPLGSDGRAEGGGGRRKRRLAGVPDGLEAHAAMVGDHRVEQPQMPLDRAAHGQWIPFPERGAPLDVGEEEADRAGGQCSHRPSSWNMPEPRPGKCPTRPSFPRPATSRRGAPITHEVTAVSRSLMCPIGSTINYGHEQTTRPPSVASLGQEDVVGEPPLSLVARVKR
jgi:hypothetical protein